MNLEQQTNFDILLAILREHNAVMLKNQDCVLLVLSLLMKLSDAETSIFFCLIDCNHFNSYKVILLIFL
jgi:hypothetical protein